MRLGRVIGFCLGFCAAAWIGQAQLCVADVVDRILAVVDRHIILDSDLDEELRFESLAEGKTLRDTSAEERQAALQRLIDRALIAGQAAPLELDPVAPEQIAARLNEIRQSLSGAQTEEGWRRIRERYGFAPEDLDRCIAEQLNVLRLIEIRFRPMIHVREAEIESYYHDQLVPELTRRGTKVPVLKDVSSRIESIIMEQRTNELLTSWLKSLRSQSRIKVLDPGKGVLVEEPPAAN